MVHVFCINVNVKVNVSLRTQAFPVHACEIIVRGRALHEERGSAPMYNYFTRMSGEDLGSERKLTCHLPACTCMEYVSTVRSIQLNVR